METRYKFQRILPRDDTADIKHKCYVDSVSQKESEDNWTTLYNDTYTRHQLGRRSAAAAPRPGISIGGGNLAPSLSEMRKSSYAETFHKYDESAVPPRAGAIKPSDIFPHENTGPMETIEHMAMKEAVDNRPPYDNRDAKARVADAKQAHFYFGDDAVDYKTNYERDFVARPNAQPSQIDNQLQKSSVAFDSKAGLGPHARAMEKKGTFPAIADAEKPNVQVRHWDIGYDKPSYETTMEVGLRNGLRGGRPISSKAPPCAEFATHGDAAGRWQTFYESDFQDRKPDPNHIDKADLRATHFDIGHEKGDWQRPQMATADQVPQQGYMDLQSSNVVFRGDGDMRWQTTSGDLIGNYDRTKDGRGKMVDAREAHLFLGGEAVDYTTTAKDANRLAGTGQPARPMENLHLKRGVGFARGGAWNQWAEAPTDAEDKVPMGYHRPNKIDGTYFKESHFELDATGNRKDRWKTTYFQDICKSKIIVEKEKQK